MIKHRLQQQISSQNNQAGFTIIESLIALIVVAILMVAIAPVIVLSTATRLQAKRVERATQAAKAYIDGVTSGAITAPPITTDNTKFPAIAPISGNLTPCDTNKYCSSVNSSYGLYCIDGDGDSKCTKEQPNDIIIQAFGLNSNSTNASRGYRLGMRVYRADTFKTGITLKATIDKYQNGRPVKQQLSFIGGSGLRGSKEQPPLLDTTTDIVTQQTTFKDFCSRLQDPSNNNNNNNKISQC